MQNDNANSLLNNTPKFSWRPIAFFLLALFIEAIIQIALSLFINTEGYDINDSIIWMMGKVGALILAIILYRKQIIESTRNLRSNIKWYLISFIISFAVFYLFEIGTSYYSLFMNKLYNIGEATNQTTIYQYFYGSDTTANYIILFLTIVVLAPLLEELTYREFIFKAFKGCSWLVPLFISTLLFGIAHLDFTNLSLQELSYFPMYLLPGFALCLIYHYNKNNFWMSFAVHATINLISFIQIMNEIMNTVQGVPV